jgi:ferredoxin-thioredoxin reductase catalytic subunit|nr:MAG TPA: ferredoxin-thioredoxin reductase [Caudoviricetes sp.]
MKVRLNPDEEFVKDIKRQLKANSGYCPCSLVKNEDTKCMCKEFREMDSGMCHCGLYIKDKEESDQ